MTVRHERFRHARSTPALALLKEEGNAVAPEPDSRARIACRRALGLGALASLFAFIGRGAARAADALTIDPNGQVKIDSLSARIQGNNTLEFGAGIQGKESSAGKIGYQAFGEKNALDIAGAGSDPGGDPKKQNRKIKLWAEGGTALTGDLTVAGTITGKGAVPPGAILMWSGDPTNLSPGWTLCDGQNGTPDLRGRFIVGYNPSHPDYNTVKNTGGEDKHTLSLEEMPVHDHGSAGKHVHGVPWGRGLGDDIGFATARNQGGKNTDEAGDHVHQKAGGGKPHENRPPYLVLAFIMYTGK
jgi:hypothetical protein